MSSDRQALKKVKKEKAAAESHAELLDMIVPPMEEQRREMKDLLLASRHALIEAGVPAKQKSDNDIPQFYACNSWEGQSVVPWNAGDKRVLYPAEGIEWLSAQSAAAAKEAKAEIRALRAEVAALKGHSNMSKPIRKSKRNQ